MKCELELMLQRDFPFMKQNNVDEEKNLYRRFGCDCGDGWYELLSDCCRQISDRYAKEGVPVDFVPTQIKEKFGTLRFYYSYEDAPCSIAAFDCLGSGTSVRFETSNESVDEKKQKLRQDIADIVRKAEERSKHTCEICGHEGVLRTDLRWIRTLCNSCYDKHKVAIENSKNRS